MTCIVGFVARGGAAGVWLGADSASVGGWTANDATEEKVFAAGEIGLGFAGSWRMGQVLKYELPPQRLGAEGDPAAWLVRAFVPACRELLRKAGALKVDHVSSEESPGPVLVAVRGRLFEITQAWGVVEARAGYDAIGSGDTVALGALHAARGGPRARVTAALEAAVAHNIGVRPPFVIRRFSARPPRAKGSA